MAIRRSSRGFVLLIAVIFMSVMLTFGLALGSLAYKQQVLASSAVESQYAFYAADAGLECALYADQQAGAFTPYPASAPALSAVPSISCDGASVAPYSSVWTSSVWTIAYRQFPIDAALPNPRCADVTIYKYSAPQATGVTTYVFSQGYDVSCGTVAGQTGARFSSRGLNARY